MDNHIERTENRTNANLQKDGKKKQKEENTQIDTNQVPPKHIEITASQQTPPILSTTKKNKLKRQAKKHYTCKSKHKQFKKPKHCNTNGLE